MTTTETTTLIVRTTLKGTHFDCTTESLHWSQYAHLHGNGTTWGICAMYGNGTTWEICAMYGIGTTWEICAMYGNGTTWEICAMYGIAQHEKYVQCMGMAQHEKYVQCMGQQIHRTQWMLSHWYLIQWKLLWGWFVDWKHYKMKKRRKLMYVKNTSKTKQTYKQTNKKKSDSELQKMPNILQPKNSSHHQGSKAHSSTDTTRVSLSQVGTSYNSTLSKV